VPLLVAVQVYQFPVVVRVTATQNPWFNMVTLEFLSIEEVHATQPTGPVLSFSQLAVTVRKVPNVDTSPFPPVFPQTGVVGGSPAFNQDVPDNLEPTELQEITPGAFVAKDPVVVPLWIQLAPVPLLPPVLGFRGMGVPGVLTRTAVHPVIHLVEHFR